MSPWQERRFRPRVQDRLRAQGLIHSGSKIKAGKWVAHWIINLQQHMDCKMHTWARGWSRLWYKERNMLQSRESEQMLGKYGGPEWYVHYLLGGLMRPYVVTYNTFRTNPRAMMIWTVGLDTKYDWRHEIIYPFSRHIYRTSNSDEPSQALAPSHM